ncbi:hypothetical protein BD779DRAFT_1501913 [Infundibulicybe gibba]|nr:hypothetical protein BD779DRAFT_1501913 [Infundibulicybe gibba]
MSETPKIPISYDAVMLFWRTVTQIFFREIRPRGAFNIPPHGPVIFVAAPHNNQFLDPLLLSLEVYRETHRSVQFLAAAKSVKRKVVGFFIRQLNSIPVFRAADSAMPGSGLVWLSPDDPCLVLGEGTKFLAEFSPRMQIMLPKSLNSAIAEVSEVISDTELKIKREFGGESGKGTLRIRERVSELRRDGVKGLSYKRLPFVDQQEIIGIFPEGGSHDRTDLLPLKAGVKIVPVGLSYFHAHRFRSRAVVEFGAALDVPMEFVEMFKQGAPDYDTLMLIQAVRRLYKTPGQHLTLGQVVELNRRLLEGYTHFKDEPRVQNLRKADLGLRDHQVPRAQKAGWKTLGLLTYRIILLMVWTILALPGTILNGPMFILATLISRKKAKEALAASEVKIAGRDVLATWKVLISLGVAPVLYIIYAFLATFIAIKAQAPLKYRIWTPFLVMIVLPFMNYAALKFGEAGVDVLKSLRPLIVALVPGQQRSLDHLKSTRIQLSNEVADLINELGPTLYGDFNEWRILVPSASKKRYWCRRRTRPGAHHPMTWIDERLFGWSRSAQRGTSAWGGVSGDEASRVATPDISDEEDTGDYDNVVGIIPTYDEQQLGSIHKSRSRQSSYADLQRLRISPLPKTE